MNPEQKKEIFCLFHESRTNLLLGAKGAGKTNAACCLMEILAFLGYDVWTNINFFRKSEIKIAIERNKLPQGYIEEDLNDGIEMEGIRYDYKYLKDGSYYKIHTISTLSELLYGLIRPGKKAVFLDEAGIISPSGTSKDTKTMKQLAYIIRHFDCAFTLITQVAGSVPPDLRENLVDFRFEVIKTYQNKPRDFTIGKRTVSTNMEGEQFIDFPIVKHISGLGISSLPCDGDFPSSFNVDIDLKKTLDEFSKLQSSLELETKGKEVLDTLVRHKKPPETTKERVRRLKKENPKWTQKQIAEEIGCSIMNVCDHLRK